MIVGHIGGGSVGVDTGDIGHSLRFRAGATAYLTRTSGSPTNKSKWTLSFWVKRAELSRQQILFGATISATANFSVEFSAANNFQILFTNTLGLVSSEVERDPTSYVHFVISYDSGNATASNRCRVWKNGSEITSWSTDNRASIGTANDAWNTNALLHYIGSSSASYKNDDYKARIAFVDGTSVTDATSFGYLNTEINEWVSKSASAVKAVVDAGGTNSFMLDFDDGTSLTTLGYDKSSKGNNWTLNNFSLTAGTSYDWMLDVPGNSFATLNPLFPNPSTFTVSNGNLSYVSPSSNLGLIHGTMPFPSSGTWWFEVACVNNVTYPHIGIDQVPRAVSASSYLGENATGYAYIGSGQKYTNAAGSAYGASYTTGDVIGVLFDATNGTLSFYKQTGGTGSFSAQGTAFTGLTSGTYFPALSDTGVSTVSLDLNFGQRTFNYVTQHGALPSSAKALCQRNMPDVAILNSKKHFDVLLWTGDNNARNITGLAFDPDLLETKCRNTAESWRYHDRVRGKGTTYFKTLASDTTAAEAEDTLIDNFITGGFHIAAGGNSPNVSGRTYAGFAWKAGGAAVTNNAGSISSQVSANVTAGFSIVTYTGTGANATVGHGLGKAPGLVIVKERGGVNDWPVYHSKQDATPQNGLVYLNATNAYAAAANVWNNTAPTTTTFSIGTNGAVNNNTDTYVAYCFAEIPGFSKIFSYTGNGSTDGPFVHCGFKPKYVLIKRTDTAGYGWPIYDAVRSPDNICNEDLYTNSANAEAAFAALDFTSNGVKLRSADAYTNANGGTYIGIAFADVPAKYSLAR